MRSSTLVDIVKEISFNTLNCPRLIGRKSIRQKTGYLAALERTMPQSIPEIRIFFFVYGNHGRKSLLDIFIHSKKREYEDYQQLPEEAATAWAERFTLHSAGGVSKRAHMPCLYASAVLRPLYLCPFMMIVGDPVTL